MPRLDAGSNVAYATSSAVGPWCRVAPPRRWYLASRADHGRAKNEDAPCQSDDPHGSAGRRAITVAPALTRAYAAESLAAAGPFGIIVVAAHW